MDDLITVIKKWLIVGVIIILAIIYIRTHYTFRDILAYTDKNPSEKWTPRIEYYVGTIQFMRSRPKEAEYAYNQLLADYPTTQYLRKVLYRLGDIYKEKRDFGNARKYYGRYLKEFPDAPNQAIAQRKYDYIKFK